MNEEPNAMTSSGQGIMERLKARLGSADVMKRLSDVASNVQRPERVARMVMLAVYRNPQLQRCSVDSIIAAAMTSAQLGLDCSGTLGSGYLVPFGNTAQFIPGYRGLIDLCRRAGIVKQIESHIVYAGDEFVVEYGLEPRLVHKPRIDGIKGDAKAVYAIATLTDGGKQFELMSIAEIEAIRRRSKAADSGPWVTDWNEMARKTVIRRLHKYLPQATDMEWRDRIERAIESEDEATGLELRAEYQVSEPATKRPLGFAGRQALDKATVEPPPPVKHGGRPLGSKNRPKEVPVLTEIADEPNFQDEGAFGEDEGAFGESDPDPVEAQQEVYVRPSTELPQDVDYSSPDYRRVVLGRLSRCHSIDELNLFYDKLPKAAQMGCDDLYGARLKELT